MRSTGYFRIGLVIAVSLASAISRSVSPVHGQQKTGDSLDVAAAAEAAALRDVDVKMTHPDPGMRIGYLQAFVTEGNARKIERAIQIALASQDEGLRALGFRAYLASTGSLTLDIALTPQEKQQIEDRRTGRGGSLPTHLDILSRAGHSINLQFERSPITSTRGFVSLNRVRMEYAMRGDRLTFSGYAPIGSSYAQCNWDLRPTRDLKIAASLACQNWARVIQLEAAMF
jgi:hypothetical protein